MRVFKQLTLTDRIRIEKWLKDGLRVKEIADRLRAVSYTHLTLPTIA